MKIENMSKYVDYNLTCEGYDNDRVAAGSDVICALMQLYCRKELKNLFVLDAGCGTGNYAKALIENGIGHVTLLDASPGMLEFAKLKLGKCLHTRNVQEVVQATFPPLPFNDESFDAVMFNTVLNHLDKAEVDDFPTCVQTLREARRTLKAGGVIIISTILQSTMAINVWAVQVDKSIGDRMIKNVPSLEQFNEMFEAAGISCKQKLNILGTSMFPNYYTNPEIHFSHFLDHANATDSERKAAFQALIEFKQKGKLKTWMEKYAKTKET